MRDAGMAVVQHDLAELVQDRGGQVLTGAPEITISAMREVLVAYVQTNLLETTRRPDRRN